MVSCVTVLLDVKAQTSTDCNSSTAGNLICSILRDSSCASKGKGWQHL